jgi:hypothetical protein
VATLDHVVPLSERGDHSYANVRLAHYLCNANSQRPPADLRRLITMLRTSWEDNAATARRFDDLALSAINVRVEGDSRRRVHLARRDDDVWLPACRPDDPHTVALTPRTLVHRHAGHA